MPKLFPRSLLKIPEAQFFCSQRQITDVNCLRLHLRDSVCLGIDVEGCEGIREGITSIGLAILPPTDFLARPYPSVPFETRKLVKRHRIESHCIYVEGRSRRKKPPEFPFAPATTTSAPGEKIRAIIEGIKRRYTGKDIVLIGWHPYSCDFPAIQALVPSLSKEFTGWVDVVNVMQQICISKQEDLSKSWPPLSDVMLCVGFDEKCLPRRAGHSAGEDAIHAVSVLARLLTYNSDELPVELRRRRPLKTQTVGGAAPPPSPPALAEM